MSTSTPAEHGRRSALARAEKTQHVLLEAQEHLYTALGRPQPLRERRWAAAVGAEVGAAIGALREHRLEVEGRDGLYGELLNDAPWVTPRIRQISAQLRRLEAELVELQIEAARVEAGDNHGLGAIRADAERALLVLRDLLSKEADLIYERFREPAALD